MTTHELKSWPEFFAPVERRKKTFELRIDDRHFEVGDVLVLREWVPDVHGTDEGRYTGRELRRRVTFVMQGLGTVGVIPPLKGLLRGYVILALEPEESER